MFNSLRCAIFKVVISSYTSKGITITWELWESVVGLFSETAYVHSAPSGVNDTIIAATDTI